MKRVSLASATGLYSCSDHHRSNIMTVDHVALRQFCRAIAQFEHVLVEAAEDELVKRFVSRLRRHRFDLCFAPLPLKWRTGDLAQAIDEFAGFCRVSYARLMPYLAQVSRFADELGKSDDNPLLGAIEDCFESGHAERGALLLMAPRLAADAQQILAQSNKLRSIRVVSEHELRLPVCYDHLVTIGPRDRFPDFIFTAPRAHVVTAVRYVWLRDSWMSKPAFLGAVRRPHASADVAASSEISPRQAAELGLPDGSQLDFGDALWGIDWAALSRRMAREVAEAHDQEEMEARIVVLASGMAVWLEVGEDAKALLLDLDGDEDTDEESASEIRRVPTSQLWPGMFLLLRTSGGGDYIVTIADKLLGTRAEPLRGIQEKWKSALRWRVRSNGLLETCVELLDAGSRRANETNVRNWMSGRNIRPRDYADFCAIMRVTGLESFAREVWQAADDIDTAHRKAGFVLRKELLKQVLSADMMKLHRTGRMDFQVPGLEGGGLSAFRIEHLRAETAVVPSFRLGRPFNLEDSEWRG